MRCFFSSRLSAKARRRERISIVIVSMSLAALVLRTQAVPVRIVGEAQMELFNSISRSSRVVETASLVIVIDGSKFRITSKSVGGFNTADDFGYDGKDLFLISNQRTPFNRDGKSVTGFAYSDSFPIDCSPTVQAVWLGFCSEGYFQNPSNHVGLPLSPLILPMTPPEFVTNIIKYAGDSGVPENIIGWSRPWIKLSPVEPPVEYSWYNGGFKVWEFSGSNFVTTGGRKLPRLLTLTAFVPDANNLTNAHYGEDVIPLRKVTFIADSVAVDNQPLNPLPPSPVPNLTIIDNRFTNMTGRFLLVSHLASSAWPTRSSSGINDTLAKAREIALQNQTYEQRPRISRMSVITILGLNLGVLLLVSRTILKKNKINNMQETEKTYEN